MKIIKLEAENFKRLQCVEITPTGNLVEISGRNGQGKSSTLDAIWVALAGKSASPAVPIRTGQEEARIKLDMGSVVITRNFRRGKDGDYTTSLAVTNAEGMKYPSPQTMLDGLVGSLSFDPLAFARMAPKDQFETLKRFVPEVDFNAIAQAQKVDYDKRTEINRKAADAKANAEAIMVPEGTPATATDEAALVAELEAAGKSNTEIETRRLRREQAERDVIDRRRVAQAARDLISSSAADKQAQCDATVADLISQIEALKSRIESVKAAAAEDIRVAGERLATQADTATAEANEIQAKLDNAEALPAVADTAALKEKIEAARIVNKNVALAQQKKDWLAKAKAAETESEKLTKAMKDREEGKRQKIAAAKMPVEGISFGDDSILLNGVPFDQASDAEKLRVSVAIAAASNPKLRVIRIRDGSLLDSDSMKLLSDFAAAQDFQIWIETVGDTGKFGFILEDGKLKAQEAA